MLECIRVILSNYTDVAEITEDSELTGDLGLNSFDLVSVVNDFEQEFGIEIPDRDIRKFLNVGDVVKYLSSIKK